MKLTRPKYISVAEQKKVRASVNRLLVINALSILWMIVCVLSALHVHAHPESKTIITALVLLGSTLALMEDLL